MIKVEVVLKTDDKSKAPSIMKVVARKVSEGIVSANHPDYYFKTSDIDDVMEIFD